MSRSRARHRPMGACQKTATSAANRKIWTFPPEQRLGEGRPGEDEWDRHPRDPQAAGSPAAAARHAAAHRRPATSRGSRERPAKNGSVGGAYRNGRPVAGGLGERGREVRRSSRQPALGGPERDLQVDEGRVDEDEPQTSAMPVTTQSRTVRPARSSRFAGRWASPAPSCDPVDPVAPAPRSPAVTTDGCRRSARRGSRSHSSHATRPDEEREARQPERRQPDADRDEDEHLPAATPEAARDHGQDQRGDHADDVGDRQDPRDVARTRVPRGVRRTPTRGRAPGAS